MHKQARLVAFYEDVLAVADRLAAVRARRAGVGLLLGDEPFNVLEIQCHGGKATREPALGANRYGPAQTACDGLAVSAQVKEASTDRARPAQTTLARAKRRSSS